MVVYEWKLKTGAEEQIYKRLEPVAVSMKACDFLPMPERIDNVIRCRLTDEEMALYKRMQSDCVVALEDELVSAFSAATVCNKLLQLAGGAVYDDNGEYHVLHRAKLDALHDIVEAANGQPVLVYYGYKHEAARILDEFPQAKLMSKDGDDVKHWNAGKIPLLLCHPDSAGHGLNLQAGGHIMVWFGLTWSLEKYQQANARLHRQGQRDAVVIHHLVTAGTVDERVMDILARKDKTQEALMQAVKACIEERG